MSIHAPFEYVEPKDRGLLEQYVLLRRQVYFREYPWLPVDFGVEDETDRISQIVLAVQLGNAIAGGARLTLSTPGSPLRLPLEEADFSLKECDYLQEFELDRYPYGEISRMAVDPACSHGFEISSGLGNALSHRAALQGADVIFSICPEKPARINHINAKRLGIGFRRYTELPTVFGVKMWLCAFTNLQRVYGLEARGSK